MYILLVTFDLPIRKILKNSFIFALLGFKRNIMAKGVPEDKIVVVVYIVSP